MDTHYITKDVFNEYKKRYGSTLEELEFVESYMYGKDIQLKIGNGPNSIFMVNDIDYLLWKSHAEFLHKKRSNLLEIKLVEDGYLQPTYRRKHYKET